MSKLYNLSRYATAHVAEKGEKATGFTLSAYTYLNNDGAKEYINIYIPADSVNVFPEGDGYVMAIPFKDIKINEKNRQAPQKTENINNPDLPF